MSTFASFDQTGFEAEIVFSKLSAILFSNLCAGTRNYELKQWIARAEVGLCGKDGRGAGGMMMADTHNGAGASQRIVSQRLPTMRRNSLQQCPAMPTAMRGIACRERSRGARGASLPDSASASGCHHTCKDSNSLGPNFIIECVHR